MADRNGRRARWTSMVVVAPGAAAVFGAAVSWAATSTPTTAAAPAPATAPQRSVVTRSAPPIVHGLSSEAKQWRAVAEYRKHQRQALAVELAAVRKHVARLRAAERAALRAARHPVVTVQQSSGGGYVAGAPIVSAPVVSGPAVQAPAAPAPAPYVPAPPAPAPAPVVVQAPPVQATTGGSGHP